MSIFSKRKAQKVRKAFSSGSVGSKASRYLYKKTRSQQKRSRK